MSHIRIRIKNYFLAIFICAVLITANANTEVGGSFSVKTDSVNVANHRIVYDSIGEGRSVILLHGLFGSKNQWSVFSKFLAENGCHVIVPDLPGYGKSIEFPEEYYAIEKQVELLNQFVTKLRIDKFAIAGNSMGGLIAAEYAKKYPDKVTSLAFIGSPLGVKSPQISKTEKVLESGKNPFIPLTEEQLNQEMKLLFTNPPKLTDEQVQNRIARYQVEKNKDLRIWDMIKKNQTVLNKPLGISIPTLILWGDSDNVYDVSGAEILKNNIKNSELIIVKNGSHLFFIENPKKSAKYYLDFLKLDILRK